MTEQNQKSEYFEVRCTTKIATKNGEACNRLLIKVAAGSKGEAYCTNCKKHFEFEVNDQNRYEPLLTES